MATVPGATSREPPAKTRQVDNAGTTFRDPAVIEIHRRSGTSSHECAGNERVAFILDVTDRNTTEQRLRASQGPTNQKVNP